MRGIAHLKLAAVLLALLLAWTSALTQPGSYKQLVLDWRADRLAKLTGQDGYLNLAGLFWLKPGTVSFGADPASDLVFAGSDVPRIGQFELGDDGVLMTVEDGVEVMSDGVAAKSLLLADDTTEQPVTVTHGSLAWSVIQRQGRYAVRLRDFENPALAAFPELEYFPINANYRVVARLVPFDEPKVLTVGTVIEGLGWEPRSPGEVEFLLGGERYTLEAYESGDRLFFVFGDKTNGSETYPAGRFLYAGWPDASGLTVLDFNMSYSPPCAFNDFSTCPVASPRNRLPVRVPVGELHNKAAYVGSQ